MHLCNEDEWWIFIWILMIITSRFWGDFIYSFIKQIGIDLNLKTLFIFAFTMTFIIYYLERNHNLDLSKSKSS